MSLYKKRKINLSNLIFTGEKRDNKPNFFYIFQHLYKSSRMTTYSTLLSISKLILMNQRLYRLQPKSITQSGYGHWVSFVMFACHLKYFIKHKRTSSSFYFQMYNNTDAQCLLAINGDPDAIETPHPQQNSHTSSYPSR